MTDTSDFDWSDSSNTVIAEQPATAVHRNPAGDVVIRQRDSCRDEDSCIFVRPKNVQPSSTPCWLSRAIPAQIVASSRRRHLLAMPSVSVVIERNRKNQERNESNDNNNELSLRLVTEERAS